MQLPDKEIRGKEKSGAKKRTSRKEKAGRINDG